MIKPNAVKWQLSALAIALLAACGGQDAPSSGNLTPKAATGQDNAVSQTGSNDPAASSTDSGANATASTPPTVAPLSDRGVRGDVLAAALRLDVGSDQAPITLEPASSSGKGGAPGPDAPVQMVVRATGDYARTGLGRYLHESHSFSSATTDRGDPVDFDEQRIMFGMTPGKRAGNQPDGIVLRINDTALWKKRHPYNTQVNENLTLKAETGLAIKRDDTFPMGADPIYSWQYRNDEEVRRVEVSLIVDEVDLSNNSFTLCLTADEGEGRSLVRPLNWQVRSTCTVWQVPADWQPDGGNAATGRHGTPPLTAIRHGTQFVHYVPVMHDSNPLPIDYARTYRYWRFVVPGAAGN